MKRTVKLCALVLCFISQPAFPRIITSLSDTALGGGNRITLDNLPVGYLEDTYTSGSAAIDGVTFTENTIIIDGVTFSSAGATRYFARGEEVGAPDAEMIALNGLAINREGEQFGSTTTSSNLVLQQRTENRALFADLPGPETIIQVTFNPPVIAFGLNIGTSNQSRMLEIYNTDNTLVATIPHTPDIANASHFGRQTPFVGYSIDSDSDKKISYIKWGNGFSHDAIWIDNLTYSHRTVTFASWLKEHWPWVLSILVILAAMYVFRRRRYLITTLK